MHRSCQNGLRSLVERSITDETVVTLLKKIKGGVDHWLTFVGEPAVSLTNNAAENALREPVVLRKIIGNSVTIEVCSFTRQSCPCWHHVARRDATPTKNFAKLSAAMR